MVDKTKIVKMNLSVLGVYIRIARLNAGISLRSLAAITNISHTLISNIEMGKQTPSEETLKEIMKALDITLDVSDEISKKMSYYFKNIFSNIMSYQRDIAKKYVDELESKAHLFIHSLEVMNYHIIISFYNVITGTKASSSDIEMYEEVIKYLTPEQQKLVYYIKGLDYLREFMFFSAEKYFLKALDVKSSEIDVLINESLVTAYLYQYKFTSSVSLCTSVIEEYERRSNYIRAMRCRLLIARVYLKIMKFDNVMTQVEHVSEFAKQFQLQYLLDDCHVIRAGVLFYEQKYEKAIYELNQVQDTTVERYSYTRFRIYLVSGDKRLNEYYEKIIQDTYKPLSYSTKLLIKILMKWQCPDYRDEAYLFELDELREIAVNGNDQELLGLMYNLLIIYYKEDRKYKKALEISEELLKHKKIHISYYSIKPNTIYFTNTTK